MKGSNDMNNRIRNNQLKIYLSNEEKELFEKKRQLAKCKNMILFIRKCILEKEIYIVDLEPFRDIQGLLFIFSCQVQKCYSFYSFFTLTFSLQLNFHLNHKSASIFDHY